MKNKQRGFTLVEMLAVVAMVGILAAIGIVSYRAFFDDGKRSEVNSIMAAIAISEEDIKSEQRTYLTCSSSLSSYYPRPVPDAQKTSWNQPKHPNYDCWKRLGRPTNDVRCVYSVVSGMPGEIPPDVPGFGSVLGIQSDAWYIVSAACDVRGTGQTVYYWMSSVDGEIRNSGK